MLDTTTQSIPNEIKSIYPFKSNYYQLESGEKMHYIDEGQGDIILLIHGNPTWSFYYRNVIKELSQKFRVIAPDHIGCGLSDKPQNYEYTLSKHIKNLTSLKESLGIQKYSLIVHDWGGAIGIGMATDHPEELEKLVILNTAAYTSKEIPFRINFCKMPILGEKIIRHFNAFAWPATFMAVSKKMSKEVKKGYLYPYSNYKNRIATAKFVQDIPLDENHQSYKRLKDIEDKLNRLSAEKLILWGEKDFCFNMNFLKRWKDIYPETRVVTYPEAGHYILEDAREEVLKEITNFFS